MNIPSWKTLRSLLLNLVACSSRVAVIPASSIFGEVSVMSLPDIFASTPSGIETNIGFLLPKKLVILKMLPEIARFIGK